MSIPRIISKFESKKFRISNDITFSTYFNQQLDAFLIFNSFNINDTIDNIEKTHSGDGNFSFSNGFSIDYSSDNKSFFSSFTIQGRSCLLPNDIRLLSPNPMELLSSISFVTPAIDAMTNTVISFNERSNLSINSMFEFTNKSAILFYGSISARIGISKDIFFVTSVSKNDQIKGMSYFWYPASKNLIDFQFHYFSNALSLSLFSMPESNTSLSISFRKYIR